MSDKSIATIAAMGIDTGKQSFPVVGLDRRGAITLRQMWPRGQVEARLAGAWPSEWSERSKADGSTILTRGPLQAMVRV